MNSVILNKQSNKKTFEKINNLISQSDLNSLSESDLDILSKSYLELSNRQISEINNEIFNGLSSITRLYLSNNLISVINNGAFNGLSSLSDLDLSNNQISVINNGAFNGLSSLKYLYLSNNLISVINNGAFNGLSSLSNFDLSNNQISVINNGAFNGLSSLSDLDLSNNQISVINNGAFNGLGSLKYLYLSNNLISVINNGAFNGLSSLSNFDLSNNQISVINNGAFNGLSSLKYLYLSNNLISVINNGAFNGLSSLFVLNLSNNQISVINNGAFNGLSSLKYLYLSNNLISVINNGAFNGLSSLFLLNLSNNQISVINNGAFNGLSSLKYLYLSNNQISVINNGAFNGLSSLSDLDLSNNQISVIKIEAFNNNLNNLIYFNLSNNCLLCIDKEIFTKFKSCYFDFKNNIQINDMAFLFDVFLSKLSLHNLDYLDKKFYKMLNDQIEAQDKYVLIKKSNYENSILLFYLNFSASYCKELYENQNNDELSFLNRIKTYETILDFLISYELVDSSFIINFKKYVDNICNQNKNLINLEFKLKSAKTLECIIKRDNLLLFEIFFKLEISAINYDTKFNPNSNIFDLDEFYSKIDFNKCFEITLKTKNEKIAIYLLRMFIFIFKHYYNNDQRDMKVKYTNLFEFNQKLIYEYYKQIFENKWFKLINIILDLSLENNFIYLVKDESIDIKNKNEKNDDNKQLNRNSKVAPSKDSNSEQLTEVVCQNDLFQNESKNNAFNDFNDNEDNILKLINKSKNFDLLSHEKTKILLFNKWKHLPKLIYYFNLVLFLLFIILYSLNISIYYTDNNDSIDLATKIVCYILLTYFIILEIIQIIHSWKRDLIFYYGTRTKNFIELLTFPLSILTLSLQNTDLKSSLFSSTILMSYFILILRLDKFYGIGPYVNLFGKIIIRSYKLFFILMIILLGFLLSIKNRSNYYLQLKNTNQTFDAVNEITAYEGDFANNFYQIVMMAIGAIQPDKMGITSLNQESLINFIIYGIFIFIMPILFINIFTGIAIDELRELLKKSEIEIISIKIDYVYEIDQYYKLENYEFKILGNINNFFDKFIITLLKFKWFDNNVQNYKNKSLEKDEKIKDDELKNILIELEEKNYRILSELKHNSSVMQSQFDFINENIKKIEGKMKTLNKEEIKGKINKEDAVIKYGMDEKIFEEYNQKILNELKNNSLMVQNKFDIIDKKIQKINKKEEKQIEIQSKHMDVHKKNEEKK
jgi:Leucine-rich repeat (LRR) protein